MNYYQRIFEAVNVTELPPFHNASNCQHSARFQAMYREAERRGSLWDHRGEQEVGRRFLETISAEDLALCHYHRANWIKIANESVKIILELGRQDTRVYAQAARDSYLEDEERRWLVSLFDYPIGIEGVPTATASIVVAHFASRELPKSPLRSEPNWLTRSSGCGRSHVAYVDVRPRRGSAEPR